MSDYIPNPITQDWDDLAIDDGSFYYEKNEYRARLEDREGNVVNSEVDSIAFRSEVNTAPSITIGVEPLSALEGDDYLNGTVDVFVNGEILFAGKIVRIEMSRVEGDYYQVKAHSQGRKLIQEVIDENPQNEVLQDFLVKTVDKYDTWDDEHLALLDTGQESLTNIEKRENVRNAYNSTSEAKYTNVGPDASAIEKLYDKIKTDPSVTVEIETASSSYTETFINGSETKYGDWYKIEPTGLESEEYDISFTLDNSYLYDWISVTGSEVQRESEPFEIEGSESSRTLQSASTKTEWEQVIGSPSSTDVYQITNDGDVVTRKSSDFKTTTERTSSNGSPVGLLSEAENENAFDIKTEGGDEYIEWNFSLDYDIEADNLSVGFRSRSLLDDDAQPGIMVEIDGREFGSNILSGGDFHWTKVQRSTTGDYGATEIIDSGLHRVRLIHEGGNGDTARIDVCSPHDNRFNYTFDNTVDSNNLLSGPESHPDRLRVKGANAVTTVNVGSATLSATMDDTSGNQELQITFNQGNDWYPPSPDKDNTSSVNADAVVPTRSVQVRFGIGRTGTRDTASPTQGFNSQELQSFSLDIDTNDLEVIHDQEFTDNRLAVISSLADDSRVLFRWEGNRCRSFKRGSRKVSDDLRMERVQSYTDIEEVYSSAEVKGANGITSGVIEAQDAPDYIDNHIEIRDEDISDKFDAERRAESLLANNSAVEYSGSVTTLPTRVPVGEELPGSVFNHGQPSIIKSASYGKRRTSLQVGRIKDFGQKVLLMERDIRSSSEAGTS